MLAAASHAVEGHVTRGFEAVREAFAETSLDEASWAAPAVPIVEARRSSTCGAGAETSELASRGSRTPW